MDTNHIIEHEYKENCFILTSFTVVDGDYGMELKATPTVSFLYRDERYAAEWEVQYGPIQMWEKAYQQDTGAREHYVYPFIKDIPANWSQMGVDRSGLKMFLKNNEFDAIFNVLKDWAVRD